MTDLKFEILEHLYLASDNDHIGESELLNPFVNKRDKNINSAKHALNQMIEQGYVLRITHGQYRIAIKGIDIYEAEHTARLIEQASEKLRIKQTHHDWFIALFGVLGGAVTAIITSIIVWRITGT